MMILGYTWFLKYIKFFWKWWLCLASSSTCLNHFFCLTSCTRISTLTTPYAIYLLDKAWSKIKQELSSYHLKDCFCSTLSILHREGHWKKMRQHQSIEKLIKWMENPWSKPLIITQLVKRNKVWIYHIIVKVASFLIILKIYQTGTKTFGYAIMWIRCVLLTGPTLQLFIKCKSSLKEKTRDTMLCMAKWTHQPKFPLFCEENK